MPDYIYLLENRLSTDQQNALRLLREAARETGTILFLTGDAVRDLTSGHTVRELEVAMHGNALKLKKTMEKIGAVVWGEDEASRTLYLCFPGTVRVDLVSTYRAEYPKPGKPIYYPATIQEYLRCRDFTVNAMAISLNEGSFGLLMDPMNGAADIESRTLRVVSNYGFLEEPSLLIRATRYNARLGWEMDPKTHTRCQNAKEADVIEHLSAEARSRELEQIGHEEEGLKVLQALDAEGWMKVLFSAWTPAKADEERLTALHDLAVELRLQGVHPDMSAAQMRLLTAKLAPKEMAALKKLMLRPGFVEEWDSLDALAAGFAKKMLAKENATPSVSFKFFMNYDPEAILWLGFTSKDAAVKERFNLFLKIWPEVRQRIPHALMQEMRITAELPVYREIVQAVFLELLDGKLDTPEEARAFLEPHSPPAPPPQVTIKRPRAKRGSEAKVKESSFDDDEESEVALDDDEDLDDIGGDDDDLDLGLHLPKVDMDADLADDSEAALGEDEDDDEEMTPKPAPEPVPAKRASKPSAAPAESKKPAAAPSVPKPERAEKPVAALKLKAESKLESKSAPLAKPAAAAAKPLAPAASLKAHPASAKAAAAESKKPTPKASLIPKKSSAKAPSKPAGKAVEKHSAKAPAKPPVKAAAKPSAKSLAKLTVKVPASRLVPAKKKPALAIASKSAQATKSAVKKLPQKPAKKR
jgi:tRNA nucleotidyltransferase/poly(A) polymerase